MKSVILCLALVTAPVAAFAQAAPVPADEPAAMSTPSAQALATMRESRAAMEQLRLQTRTRLLSALTPAHRTLLANAVGQLVLSVNPNPQTVATQLDAVLFPAEKQSILNIEAAQHASAKAVMQQTRAAFEASLSADERARMTARSSKMDAFRASHPLSARVTDPGMTLLRTLGNFGLERGRPGPHGPGM